MIECKECGGEVPRKIRRPKRSCGSGYRCWYDEDMKLGAAFSVMLFCFRKRVSCLLVSYGMMWQRIHTCALHFGSDDTVHSEMND